MKKKLVIIGSHSFQGSHLVHHALSQGFHVLGLNRSTKKSNPFNPYDWKIGSKHHLTLEQLDANDHPNKTMSMINDYQPHHIIHCTDDGRIEINDQLGNQPSIVITPAAHTYGPGQEVHELIPKIILSLLLGKKISLHNENYAMGSFIHINDVVTGTFQAAFKGVPGKTYQLATNRFISRHELVALICSRMNLAFDDVVITAQGDPSKNTDVPPASTKNHHELDWQPTVKLEEGIDTVIAWAQEWLPALKNHSMDLEE